MQRSDEVVTARREPKPRGRHRSREAEAAILKATLHLLERKPLRKVTLAEVQAAMGENLQKIEKLYVPQKSKNTEFLEGPPAEVAKKLVEKLKNELRVI